MALAVVAAIAALLVNSSSSCKFGVGFKVEHAKVKFTGSIRTSGETKRKMFKSRVWAHPSWAPFSAAFSQRIMETLTKRK